MKKQQSFLALKTIFLFSLFLTLFPSCKENNDNHLPNGDMEIILNVSAETIKLQDELYNQKALSAGWTKGSNMVTEYLFEMDIKDNYFSSSYTIVSSVEKERKITFTHEQLNELIKEHWNITNDQETAFEIRIWGLDNSSKVLESNKAEINITIYGSGTTDEYPPLWIKGGAVREITEANALITYNQRSKLYEWKGYIWPEGGFLFVFSPTNDLPSYVKGENNSIMLRTTISQPATEFSVSGYNFYKITLDPIELIIEITPAVVFEEGLWITGKYMGWNYDNMPQFTSTNENPNLLIYEGQFEHGDAFNIPVGTQTYGSSQKRDRLIPVSWNDWGWGQLFHTIPFPYEGQWFDYQYMKWEDFEKTQEWEDSANWNGASFYFWFEDNPVEGTTARFRITVDALTQQISVLKLD